MSKDKLFLSSVEEYIEQNNLSNHRFRSWEYCYQCFSNARNKTHTEAELDYLSLQLAFYLASWGMYRGSSFLLQKDYKVHLPVVKIILNSKYDNLFALECDKLLLDSDLQNNLQHLNNELMEIYEKIRQDVKDEETERQVSPTLISKVLLGTLGCVPAYDQFFTNAVKEQDVTTGQYNLASLLKLAEFYVEHKAAFEKVRKTLKFNDIIYPQMKLLDMGFWQIGFANNQLEKRRNKNANKK